jgi:hypothetical protein
VALFIWLCCLRCSCLEFIPGAVVYICQLFENETEKWERGCRTTMSSIAVEQARSRSGWLGPSYKFAWLLGCTVLDTSQCVGPVDRKPNFLLEGDGTVLDSPQCVGPVDRKPNGRGLNRAGQLPVCRACR